MKKTATIFTTYPAKTAVIQLVYPPRTAQVPAVVDMGAISVALGGTTSLSAALRGAAALAASMGSTCVVTIAFDGQRYMVVNCSASSSVSAALHGTGALAGTMTGVSSFTSGLSATGAIVVNMANTSLVNVSFGGESFISTAMAATAIMNAIIGGVGAVSSGMTNSAAMAALLRGDAALAAAMSGSSTMAALLQGAAALVVSMSGAATMSAELTGGGGGSYDSHAQAYFDAVTAAGGSLSTAEKNAINSWFVAVKADTTFSKIKGWHFFRGGNTTAAGINAVAPGTRNMTFPSGVTLVAGIGIDLTSSQYGDVGQSPYQILMNGTGDSNQNQNGFQAFSVANTSGNPGGSWGAYNGGNSSWRLQLQYNGHLFTDVFGENIGGARVITFSSTYTTAVYDFLGNRVSASKHRLLVNGTLVGEDNTNINGANSFAPSATLKLNQRGDNTEYQAGRYHFAGYGLGLTTSEETTLFNANAALRAALGL